MKPIYISSIATLLFAPQIIFAAPPIIPPTYIINGVERLNPEDPLSRLKKHTSDELYNEILESLSKAEGKQLGAQYTRQSTQGYYLTKIYNKDGTVSFSVDLPNGQTTGGTIPLPNTPQIKNQPTASNPTEYPPLNQKPLTYSANEDHPTIKKILQEFPSAKASDIDVIDQNGVRVYKIWTKSGPAWYNEKTPAIVRIEILQPNFDQGTYAKYLKDPASSPLLTKTSVSPLVNQGYMSRDAANKLGGKAIQLAQSPNPSAGQMTAQSMRPTGNRATAPGGNGTGRTIRRAATGVATTAGITIGTMYLEDAASRARATNVDTAKMRTSAVLGRIDKPFPAVMETTCENLAKIPANHVLDDETFFMTSYRAAVEACRAQFPEIKFNVRFPEA